MFIIKLLKKNVNLYIKKGKGFMQAHFLVYPSIKFFIQAIKEKISYSRASFVV
jgi:hypothetical protein